MIIEPKKMAQVIVHKDEPKEDDSLLSPIAHEFMRAIETKSVDHLKECLEMLLHAAEMRDEVLDEERESQEPEE